MFKLVPADTQSLHCRNVNDAGEGFRLLLLDHIGSTWPPVHPAAWRLV